MGGLTSGITYKHKFSNHNAFEGIATFGYRNALITGLYEVHRPIENANGLQWFYGGGGHIGVFANKGRYWIYKDHGKHVYVVEDGPSILVPGFDFILGLEYKFNNAPFTLGLDFKPFIDIRDGLYAYPDGALSFRFVF